jgi:hypothetical protein
LTNQTEGSNERDKGTAVAEDSSGYIYVVATTEGNFNGVTSNGYIDIFIIKYNSSGNIQWTELLGTSANEGNANVSLDSSGNVYVMEYTSSALSGHSNNCGTDIILAKYNSSGNPQWTTQYGSSENEYSVSTYLICD